MPSPPSLGGPPRRTLTAPVAAAAILVAALLLAPVLLPHPDPAVEDAARPAPDAIAPAPAPESPPTPAAPAPAAPALPRPSAAGWQDEARYVLESLEALVGGRRAGSYLEARAEAIRKDLALFPPDAAELRVLLRGGSRERTLALVAASARPPDDDAAIDLALSVDPARDATVARLLAAELAAALPPERLAVHEDAVARAFEAEPDPLVFAVALPALERLDAAGLARVLRRQLQLATPEMQAIILRLAASRVGREALRDLQASVPVAGAGVP
jgi:hypothetical protein